MIKMVRKKKVSIEISESVRQLIKDEKYIYRQRDGEDKYETYDNAIPRFIYNSKTLIAMTRNKKFKKFMLKNAKTNAQFKIWTIRLYGNL